MSGRPRSPTPSSCGARRAPRPGCWPADRRLLATLRLPPVRARHADRHLARGGARAASRRPATPSGSVRSPRMPSSAPTISSPARAAAGRGRAADRPSRHPQPRHHRRLAGLRRSGRRAAGLLRGARCDDRRPQRQRASGASRRRSSSPASTPRRSAQDELIAAVEFPVPQAGRAQRHPRAGAPLRRLRHGRRGGAGPGRRRHARRAAPRLLRRRRRARCWPSGAHGARSPASRATPETIAAAQAALDADLDPPADQHGSPEMKRHLARVLLARALERLAGSAGGAGRMSTARRHLPHRQRRARRAPRRGAPASRRFPAPRPRPDGLAHRLRARRVRRLHGARRRQDRARLPGARGLARRRAGRDHRGRVRHAARSATCRRRSSPATPASAATARPAC